MKNMTEVKRTKESEATLHNCNGQSMAFEFCTPECSDLKFDANLTEEDFAAMIPFLTKGATALPFMDGKYGIMAVSHDGQNCQYIINDAATHLSIATVVCCPDYASTLKYYNSLPECDRRILRTQGLPNASLPLPFSFVSISDVPISPQDKQSVLRLVKWIGWAWCIMPVPNRSALIELSAAFKFLAQSLEVAEKVKLDELTNSYEKRILTLRSDHKSALKEFLNFKSETEAKDRSQVARIKELQKTVDLLSEQSLQLENAALKSTLQDKDLKIEIQNEDAEEIRKVISSNLAHISDLERRNSYLEKRLRTNGITFNVVCGHGKSHAPKAA